MSIAIALLKSAELTKLHINIIDLASLSLNNVCKRVIENIQKQICFIYICKCARVPLMRSILNVLTLCQAREAEAFHGSIFVGFFLHMLLDLSLKHTHTLTQR